MKSIQMYLPQGVDVSVINLAVDLFVENEQIIYIVRDYNRNRNNRSVHDVFVQLNGFDNYCTHEQLMSEADHLASFWADFEAKVTACIVSPVIFKVEGKPQKVYLFRIKYDQSEVEMIASQHFVSLVLAALEIYDDETIYIAQKYGKK